MHKNVAFHTFLVDTVLNDTHIHIILLVEISKFWRCVKVGHRVFVSIFVLIIY